MTKPILEIKNLSVQSLQSGSAHILKDFNLNLCNGDILGLIGSSGAGKSTLANALLNLDKHMDIKAKGEIFLHSDKAPPIELLQLRAKDRRNITTQNIGCIFQNAMSILDPYEKIGFQLSETLKLTQGIDKTKVTVASLDLLSAFGLGADPSILQKYPKQLSGGMKQRVVLALALAGRPKILIADEPTSSLDGIHRLSFAKNLKSTSIQWNISTIFITHDLPLASTICNKLAFLHKGQIAETGPTQKILKNPSSTIAKVLISQTLAIYKGSNTKILEEL